MDQIKKITSSDVIIPHKGISQAVQYGNIIFVSGQVGEDVNGTVAEGIEAQVEQAILNAQSILQAAGSGLNKVLMCRCFLSDPNHFDGMNRAYFKFFGNTEVGPARYTVIAPPCFEKYLFEVAMFATV